MTNPRKLRKLQARWDTEVRSWATYTAKALTLTLYQDTDPAVAPYNVGVVLNGSEKPWVQIPARCSLDPPLPAPPGCKDPPQQAITPWLITNQRIVGRFANGDLRGWSWQWAVGCLVDLTPGREYVHLDIYRDQASAQINWYGPGVAPLAVAAVYHLHGVHALLDHPGLAALRTRLPGNRGPLRPHPQTSRADTARPNERCQGPIGELRAAPSETTWVANGLHGWPPVPSTPGRCRGAL